LEWILTPVDAARARQWADRLVDDFGSLGNTLAADEHIIVGVLGGQVGAARRLAMFNTVMTHALRCRVRNEPVFRCWDQIIDYLSLRMARLGIEQFRGLFIDSGYRIKSDEVLWMGSVAEVQCHPREVAKRAAILDATGVIVVHNHPSGVPKFSKADITLTYQIDRAVQGIGVRLYDHLVIARGGYASFREDNPLWARR
jgi:DNA repair protein RadC